MSATLPALRRRTDPSRAVAFNRAVWLLVGATAGFSAYSPGLFSSVLLFVPLWWELTRLALSEGRISRRGVAVATLIGGVIHAIVVAQQVEVP